MSMIYGGSNVTFPDGTTQNTAPSGMGFKNRIINGAMMIDQRNAGAATANTINGYTLDRWDVEQSVTGKIIAQQNAGSVTPPSGFTNYLGITSQSAYSVVSTSYYFIQQLIEGFNVADLNWGTANAQTVTLSFWVRSSLTGTFGASLRNSDGTRSYPFTYTILSANTWEQKSVTVAGDTTGTWLTNNGVGIRVTFSLGMGSNFTGTAGAWAASNFIAPTGATSVVGTNGATFYITGVQLEKGSTATSFDYRPYTTELQLCQRYYEKSYQIGTAPGDGVATSDRKVGLAWNATDVGYYRSFLIPKRTPPTITIYRDSNTATAGQWGYYNGSSWVSMTAGTPQVKDIDFRIDFATTGRSFGQALILCGDWVANAEL